MQAINIFTDFLILLFPMPIVWKLQIPKRQKLALCGVFAAGTIACVASVVRAFHVKDVITADLTYTDVNPEVWSMVEVSIGIITACLPTIRTSLSSFAHRVSSRWSSRSTFRSGKGSVSAWPKRSVSSDETMSYAPPVQDRPDFLPTKLAPVWTKVRGGRAGDLYDADLERQHQREYRGIHVQRGLEMKETYRHDI
ncbi:MAG: hypothetical protein M1814_001366 [Vezdaea aestivalis]|nr:MAG: hypothetical protein M1814_001366 [Vezdaea aestivalis]